jgi:PTS system nitrogen regulatory IIA component
MHPMRLAEITEPGLIFPSLKAENGASVLEFLAQQLHIAGIVDSVETLLQGLVEREELGSTGIGGGIAIPHCKLASLDRVVLAIATLERGIDFAALDQKPVRFFFLVVSPESSPAVHLQCLSAISRWVKGEGTLERLAEMRSGEEIHALLAQDL